jgi:hypothetical protein
MGRRIGGWICDELAGRSPQTHQVSLPAQNNETAGEKVTKLATLSSQNIQVTKFLARATSHFVSGLRPLTNGLRQEGANWPNFS